LKISSFLDFSSNFKSLAEISLSDTISENGIFSPNREPSPSYEVLLSLRLTLKDEWEVAGAHKACGDATAVAV
jgi:hypothetical protein